MKEAEEAKTAVTQIMDAAKKNNAPTSDPMDAGMQMLQHPNPKVQAVGQHLIDSLQKVQAYEQDKAFRNYGKPQPQTTFAPGALGSGTFDPNAPNQLAPAPAAAPVANALTAPSRADQLLAEIVALQTQFPNSAAAKNRVALLTKQWEEASKAYNVAPGGSLVVGGKEVYKATEKTPPPPAMVAEYEFAKTPAGGNFKGSYQQFVTARAAAGRAPAQPAAPTITQIVDPTNTNQMITIDAKRYQGGGVGSPGVIGVGGKEPGAALRVNKVEQGKTQLADDLENLRASFETLDKLRAVPSTERGPLSNVASGIASTAIGQRTGQFFATEAQVERDVINSARSRLVNSIKNATGMSAQQLNSNVELQTMLKSISDPGQSYQSAIRIIQDIEDAYVTGSGMLPKKDKPGGAPAAAQGTGGFKYLGKESK
jgi:hypothetical protein